MLSCARNGSVRQSDDYPDRLLSQSRVVQCAIQQIGDAQRRCPLAQVGQVDLGCLHLEHPHDIAPLAVGDLAARPVALQLGQHRILGISTLPLTAQALREMRLQADVEAHAEPSAALPVLERYTTGTDLLVLGTTLDADQIAILAQYGTEVDLATGDAVFVEGEPVESFFVVLEGELLITKRTAVGQLMMAVHKPGELLRHRAKPRCGSSGRSSIGCSPTARPWPTSCCPR